ncbi:MAG: ABC-type transporter, integral rane subunit, partial [Firmicutes bacterium]|nr:ABC-type transporter, integral rane subunit [Bacillota bacterium]
MEMLNKKIFSCRGTRDRSEWRAFILVIFLLLALGGIALSLSVGALSISLNEIITAIFSDTPGANRQVIWNIRLPRTLVGALVGVNLSLAGA